MKTKFVFLGFLLLGVLISSVRINAQSNINYLMSTLEDLESSIAKKSSLDNSELFYLAVSRFGLEKEIYITLYPGMTYDIEVRADLRILYLSLKVYALVGEQWVLIKEDVESHRYAQINLKSKIKMQYKFFVIPDYFMLGKDDAYYSILIMSK